MIQKDINLLKINNKYFKTFTIHETNISNSKSIIKQLLRYKHLENLLNLLLKQQFLYNQSKEHKLDVLSLGTQAFNYLLNPVIMKAVLVGNKGGVKTKDNIAFVNDYFKDNSLFIQAKLASVILNDKNISMIIRRLKKDWSNYFQSLKNYYKNPNNFLNTPSYPKAKKLSKVFHYSLPLESDKYSLKKKGYLGINLGKKMFYFYIGHSVYFNDKIINNVTVSFNHGFVYYNFTYQHTSSILTNKNNIIEDTKKEKEAGGDVGLNNLLSIFINDKNTKSLIVCGKELISYNHYFNKSLAKLNRSISYEVKSYVNIIDKNGKEDQVPESYTNEGKRLIKKRNTSFERRKLYFNDYMQKISKKIVQYLLAAKVTDLVLSKNLSFTKSQGNIKLNKKTKQKFYQIPFGNLLNIIESKAEQNLINIHWIDEAYSSKTSSISAEVLDVQNLAKIDKNQIRPNDLNGNRGIKRKNVLNNILGRGLFKDNIINKVLNSDLNAACNHIKIAFKIVDKNTIKELGLKKFNNPIKIKSNHEFDILLKDIKISKNQIVDRGINRKLYLSDVEIN